jgi:hypothetical protein
MYNLRLLHLLVHHVRFTRDECLADFVDYLLDGLRSAPPGTAFAAIDAALDRHLQAIESGIALALPVPGYGTTPRGADEAFALTALAHQDAFWTELRGLTARWRPLDLERAELLDYQRFATTARGDGAAERTFAHDWPAWDAARGRASGGPTLRPTRVRRLAPPFSTAGADAFAAGWLHAAYTKSPGTLVLACPEAAAV